MSLLCKPFFEINGTLLTQKRAVLELRRQAEISAKRKASVMRRYNNTSTIVGTSGTTNDLQKAYKPSRELLEVERKSSLPSSLTPSERAGSLATALPTGALREPRVTQPPQEAAKESKRIDELSAAEVLERRRLTAVKKVIDQL
jgi:hypothetical protein